MTSHKRSFWKVDRSNLVTSSNGRITGPLWGEFTGHRWIPLTKASGAELWCLLWSASEHTIGQTIQMPAIWDTIALIMTSIYDLMMFMVSTFQERWIWFLRFIGVLWWLGAGEEVNPYPPSFLHWHFSNNCPSAYEGNPKNVIKSITQNH